MDSERFRAAVERAVLEQLGDGDCGLRGWSDDEPCEGGLFVDSWGRVCDKNGDSPGVRLRVCVVAE